MLLEGVMKIKCKDEVYRHFYLIRLSQHHVMTGEVMQWSVAASRWRHGSSLYRPSSCARRPGIALPEAATTAGGAVKAPLGLTVCSVSQVT